MPGLYGEEAEARIRGMTRSRFAPAAWALGLLIAAAAPCAADSPGSFTLLTVGPGVYAAIARPGNEASLGNAGFVVGSESVLVVDSFATPQAARELLDEIHRNTPLPIAWLVDTHHHLDHVGGNAVFAKEGAVVVAHENARAWIRVDALAQRQGVPATDRDRFRRLVLPAVTYRDRLTIWLGDRRVELLWKPGHTGGDSIVAIPDANVVFGGDLVQKTTIPNLADAKTDAWVQTLDGLAESFPSAAFVPGHGGLARPLDLRALRAYLTGLRASVTAALREGKSGASLTDAVLPPLRGPYGSWTWFEHVQDNIAQTEKELTGTKEFPAAPTP